MSKNPTFAHLKHRVSAVGTQRKSSPLGREARRMGLSVHGDPVPEIKVTALSTDEFQRLMHTLGNWQIFVLRERLVKLMEIEPSVEMEARLRSEFYEFYESPEFSIVHPSMKEFKIPLTPKKQKDTPTPQRIPRTHP